MADAQQTRHLLDHNQWADEKIVTAIDGASADELTRPFGSIASNLLHTLNVQRLWLTRWKGMTPPPLDEPMSRRRGATRSPRRTAISATTSSP